MQLSHTFFAKLGRRVLLAFSLWCLCSSLVLWAEMNGRAVGLVELVIDGAPLWLLLIPTLVVGMLVVMLRYNRPERYWLSLLCELPLIGLMLASLDAVRGLAMPQPIATITALFSVLEYGLLALCMALSTSIPTTSFLARIIYIGIARHFGQLRQLAQRWGWTFNEPAAWPPGVQVLGS